MSPTYILRPPRYEDAIAYCTFMADPEVTVWLEDRCQRPILYPHALGFVMGEAWCRLAIEMEGRFVGMAGLEDYDLVNGVARFFIVVGERAAWNKGLGGAVLRQIVRSGFEELGLRKIMSNYLVPNSASQIIHARTGFVEEGRQREAAWRRGVWVDQILVSLLRSEWTA